MRNFGGLLIRLLLGFGLGLLSLVLCQQIWLAYISYQLTHQPELTGLPVSST